MATPQGLRLPPQSIESEQALLGSIMLRPEAMYEIIDIVSAQSFYADKHRLIFETMFELFTKSDPIDLLSVSTRLKEKNQIEKAGGIDYLTELVDSVPSSANVKHYAEIVQKKHMMRLLIEASDHIARLGYDEAQELDHLLDQAEKKIFEITEQPSTQKFTALKDTLTEAWERFDSLHKNESALRGVPSGFRDLDDRLSGFQKSDLIIIASRPSVGKTSLALDIARQAAVDHKTPIGIFSLEMSSQQLVDRMLAADSRVDFWKLRTGRLNNDEDFQRLQQSLARLSAAPIYIDDQPGNNILKMRAVARRLKSDKGLGLIIVDYLQLMLLPGGKPSDSMVQQVTEISRSLKNLARELDVPVIALSQLSRAVETRGGKPRLSDLRDSGSIEQDADIVAFIHREDKYKEDSEEPNIAEILIEKHRNGPTGRVKLYFQQKYASFQSIDKEHADPDETFANF
ncbi:replicative DNA helicase [Candidatus Wolfebacteria bacterium]|nr:replicative DNA helicase [Candidatus Wolfebacteria bacterium]